MSTEDETAEWHKKFAKKAFNDTWDLIEKPNRTPQDNDTMLHTAHASRYHWGVVGEPLRHSIGEWQVSHIYTLLGRSEPALYHAQRCLDLCIENGIGGFALAYAYEALCRAHTVAGNKTEAGTYRAEAVRAGEAIAKEGERTKLMQDLETIPII